MNEQGKDIALSTTTVSAVLMLLSQLGIFEALGMEPDIAQLSESITLVVGFIGAILGRTVAKKPITSFLGIKL